MFLPAIIINALHSVYSSSEIGEGSTLDDSLALDANRVYSHSLVTKLGDYFEIPVIARRHIENVVHANMTEVDAHAQIVTPLFALSECYMKKTFNGILRESFSTLYKTRLSKMKTGKGEIFYGGRGIILDCNFEPLLLCVIPVYKTGTWFTYGDHLICRISPKVFLCPENIVSKGIIKKIIPYYSDAHICFSGAYKFNTTNRYPRVTIIIDDIDNLITSPAVPSASTTNEVLNDCLVNNIQEVQNAIQW